MDVRERLNTKTGTCIKYISENGTSCENGYTFIDMSFYEIPLNFLLYGLHYVFQTLVSFNSLNGIQWYKFSF